MKQVVLIEDDEAIRDIFSIVFSGSNIDVISLETGAMVINSEINAPDLFVLDKNISGASGLDICQFIKASEKFAKFR